MKKLILFLLILSSAFASAQIQIPQVVGLPAALNSKVDKVAGKSLVADTLAAKIQPAVNALATKEPLLPPTPVNPETKFLNGNKQWAEIISGSGGYASNVYFTNLTSTIVGSYKQTSATADLTETVASATCNNNEVLIYTYLFEQPVGVTTVDAGVWRFTLNSIINSNVGDSKFKIVQYRRSAVGVETDMFTIYSNTIENTEYQNNIIETVQPSFSTNMTDYLGCRIYATTTANVNKTLSYKVGDGFASYLNTPLALRHSQLRDKNGESAYQHLTSSQVATFTATSTSNTGDETLTSIKTKLGAATTTSDGYLKYQDFALLHTPTTVTAANGLSISGQNISLQNASLTQSGALTFNDYNTFNSKEPAITKNTGFNLPLGNTTGSVLEGRTFGTAANSAVGDFVQINPSSAQSGGMWISGNATVGNISTNNGVGTFSPNCSYLDNTGGISRLISTGANSATKGGFKLLLLSSDATQYLEALSMTNTGAATFSSTVNSTGFLLNGNDLTSSLTTNSIPKWNGSNFVNATSGTDYQLPITLTTNGTSGVATKEGNNINIPNYGSGGIVNQSQTTINGSTSGTIVGSMPFQTGSYKKVIIRSNALSGGVTYTLPTTFTYVPHIWATVQGGTIGAYDCTTTAFTTSGQTNFTGWFVIEGY